jgi:hypothetical protein
LPTPMPSDDDCTLVATGARRATLASPLSGSPFRIPARRSCATGRQSVVMWASFLPFQITHGPRQSDRSGARREREPNHLGATGCRKGSQLSGVVQLLKTLRDSMFFERGTTLKLLDPSFVRHTSLPSDEGDPLTPAHHQARL